MAQLNKSRQPGKPQIRSSKPPHTHTPVPIAEKTATPHQDSKPPSHLWAQGFLGFVQKIFSRIYIERLKKEKKHLRLTLNQEKPFAEVYMHGGLIPTSSPLEEVNIHQATDRSSGGLIIYGEPGAGKSTLLHYLTYRVLWPNERRVDPSMRFIGGQRPGAWFPLVVDLHDEQVLKGIDLVFSNKDANSKENAENFCKWLLSVTLFKSYNLSPTQIASFTDWMTVWKGQDRRLRYIYLLYGMLKKKIFQKALIIMDGLEQVTESVDNAEVRFLQAMNDFAEQYCFKKHLCLLLVTSRYTGLLPGWHTDWTYWELTPLTPDKKRKMNYLKKIMSHDAEIDEIADKLSTDHRIANFTGNPLTLSMIAYLIYRKRGDAYSRVDTFFRGDLYGAFVEAMWIRGRGGGSLSIRLDEAKWMLGSLAYKMLQQRSRFSVSQSELDDHIRKTLENQGREVSADVIEQIRRHITDDNCAALLSRFPPQTLGRMEKWIGRLLGLSFNEKSQQDEAGEIYRFRHFTLQEYFAYYYLSKCENINQRDLYNWFCDPWWRGVLIHYLSRHHNALKIIEDLSSLPEDKTKRAKRKLEILEAQAAGYTSLTIPVSLQLELEEARKEVADFTANLRSRTEQLSPVEQMRIAFVLMQILHNHYHSYKQEIEADPHVLDHFQRVRRDIVQETLRLVEQEPDLGWEYIPDVASIGLGELLVPDDWQFVRDLLAPDKPASVRVCATRFCGKIGSETAVDILVSYLDDNNQSVQEAAIHALKDLIEQSECKVYAIVCDKSTSVHKRRGAIRVMQASTNVKYLQELISFGVADTNLREDLKKTVVEIAYDQYRDHLSGKLLCYLKEDPLDEKLRFVFEALVETQDNIATALSCCLTNLPDWFCIQDPIIAVLSARGSHYESLNHVDQSYRSMIASLLLSGTTEYVKFALRILHGSGAVWSADLVEEIYHQAFPVERRQLRSRLRYLRKQDQDKDYMSLVESVLLVL